MAAAILGAAALVTFGARRSYRLVILPLTSEP